MFTIRPFEPDEAGALRKLRLEALLAHPDCFGSTPEEAVEQTEQRYEEIASSGRVIGCFDREGGVTGMAGLETAALRKLQHRATLWGVYVNPGLRGTGAAEALLRATIALARPPVEEILLTVTLFNEPAIRLYQRLGFKRYGLDERALKLSNGAYVDELMMRLRL